MEQQQFPVPGMVHNWASPMASQQVPFLPFQWTGPDGGTRGTGPPAEPVFVLCAARSGSTLLRFLLDAHPALACPPESDLPALCAHLASVWSLLEGTPLATAKDGAPTLPGPALTGIRQTANLMIRSYLARRGKAWYCDKSLGTARHAQLLQQVFPGARFICLYRHPMDVIASGIEACPWGLKGYGFEPYAAESPGNAVQALARFWSDHASAILAVEEQFPDRCHRVRYEDLVADPEQVASGIFRFLGVPPVQGISASCFAPERERLGPADYKIWHTSRITTRSVGRGWSVPAALITPPVTAAVNELVKKLGYIRVDETWSVAERAPDLRRSAEEAPASPAERPPAGDTRQMPRVFIVLGDMLQKGLFRVSDRFVRRWGTFAAESFVIVATSTGAGSARWRVDLAARTVTLTETSQAGDGALGGAGWQLAGSADVWERVVRGMVNLNVVLRRRELRYCDAGDGAPATVTRIGMLADLLGITSWRSADATGRPEPAQPVSVA
jgi:hypothetical protein